MSKCFCHLNGYEVKDAAARNNINQLSVEINGVSENISNEINARTQQDTLLLQRIDNLTRLDEGSTTGDAELVDARTDIDGNVHANVGSHIRSVESNSSFKIGDLGSFSNHVFLASDLDMKISKHSDNSITLLLPENVKRLYYFTNGSINYAEYEEIEYIIPYCSALIFDFVELKLKVLDVTTTGSKPLQNYKNKYTVLFINHGIPKGQWSGLINTQDRKYTVKGGRFVEPRLDGKVTIKTDDNQNVIVNVVPTSSGLKRLVYVVDGKFTEATLTVTEFTIPHGSVLLFDFIEKQLKVISVTDDSLKYYMNDYSILLYNDAGNPKGVWSNLPIKEDVKTAKICASNKNTNKTYNVINRQNTFSGVPENSLYGLKLCAERGYDHVRTSIRFTSDNVVVLEHDDEINKLATNLDGSEIPADVKVSTSTYEELLNYDFGYKYNLDYIPICKLEDYLNLAKLLGIYIDIEIKASVGDERINIINNIIAKTGMTNAVSIIVPVGYDYHVLEKLHAINPSYDLTYAGNFELFTTESIDYIANFKTPNNRVRYSGVIASDLDNVDENMIIYARNKNVDLVCGQIWNLADSIKALEKGFNYIEIGYLINPTYQITNYILNLPL